MLIHGLFDGEKMKKKKKNSWAHVTALAHLFPEKEGWSICVVVQLVRG